MPPARPGLLAAALALLAATGCSGGTPAPTSASGPPSAVVAPTTAAPPGIQGTPSPTASASPRRSPSASPSPRRTAAARLSPQAAAEAEVVRLTNVQRVRNGCKALRVDPRLTTAARGHSSDMEARNYFSHDTPDGKDPWTRIKAAGYLQPGAENIAMGQPTPAAVMTAWMNSPGHRANILNCGLKAIGVGADLHSGGPWWTQDFGWV